MTSSTATVIAILGPCTVVINRGLTHGVHNGQEWLVYALGEELFDPDSKESLGTLEVVRGHGRVIHTQEAFATIKTASRKRKRRRGMLDAAGRGDRYGIIEYEEDVPFDEVRKGDLARPLSAFRHVKQAISTIFGDGSA